MDDYDNIRKYFPFRVHQEKMDYQVIQAREGKQWVTINANKATYLLYSMQQ